MSIYDTVSLYSGHSVHSGRGAMHRRKSRLDKQSIVEEEEIDRHSQSDIHYEIELPEHLVNGRKWVNSSFHSLRWVVLTLASIGLGLTFILRLSITIAIVKMVNQTYVSLEEHYHGDPILLEQFTEGNMTNVDLDDIVNTLDSEEETGEFEWSNFIQSLIVNSYYVGYALPQVFISRLADIYGPNKPNIISQMVAIVCTALVPSTAYLGWEYLVALRFIISVTGAASHPINVGLIDIWMPYYENTKALTLLQLVSCSFIVINPIMTGYLCTYHWSMVSYFTCMIGVIWLLSWLIIVRNTPEECWLISQDELKVILANRHFQKESSQQSSYKKSSTSSDGKADRTDKANEESVQPQGRPSPPWKEVFTSWTFYAITISWVCFYGTAVTFMNLMPTYLRNIMNYNIQDNGMVTFVMMSASLVSYFWAGNLISLLTGPCHWSGAKARNLTFAIAAIGGSIMWILPSFTDNYRLAIFIINKALQPALDIVLINTVMDQWSSQGLSGTMFSVYNTFASGLTVIFTWSSGYMLDKTGGTEDSWN
ncbi:Sialin [Fragariocoptes setiger]|uniref:Sialin n=1 Tax=Fragariocoptes setiger TaxID=1670756 RepID=A0ABQ7S503_9ACAR|nr:Sialin [Fragariocoptes setiger]